MPLVPLKCPSCSASLTVDSSKDAAICEFCGSPYVVKDAIINNYVTNVTNINASTVNIYSERSFDIRAGVLLKYTGESVDVVIPQSVTEIGEGCFSGMKIKSVVIPESVINIGQGAFAGCSKLTTIDIPPKVTVINESTFSDCYNLKEIKLPKGLTLVKHHAFYNCRSLVSIFIPQNVNIIGKSAFENCSNLTCIYLPETLNYEYWDYNIYDTFRGCVNLNTVKSSYNNETYQYGRLFGFIDRSGRFINCFEGTPWGMEVKKDFYRQNDLCQYCGGILGGLFKKKCNNCHREKDY